MSTKTDPWTHGPAEIYRHADEHLRRRSDTDRRLALIGFDNSIEVCIDAFIGLHPRLRGGYEITHQAAETASRTYHAKIEFLDGYLQKAQRASELDVNAIIWYHQLRNELYHSGNGMTPELRVLEGARDSARAVFMVLFGFDPSPAEPRANVDPESLAAIRPDPRSVLLTTLSAIENALASRVPQAKDSGIRAMWHAYHKKYVVTEENDAKMRRILTVRNSLAHGRPDLSETEVIRALNDVPAIWDLVKNAPLRASDSHHQ